MLWLMAGSILSAHCLAQAPVRSLHERRTENVILQQFDLSCGAAALATILKFQHGRDITERQVAIGLINRDIYLSDPEILQIRQGFSLLDMNRYINGLGYRGEALGSLEYADLQSLAPTIVPIRLHGYNHFVVYRGELEGNVLLSDPAWGNRTLTLKRFVEAWVEYADFGRVAFSVHRRDSLIPPNRLNLSLEGISLHMSDQDHRSNGS